MTETIKLIYGDKTYEFPIVTGTEGEKAFDISELRKETGLITLDYGFANTGSCFSSITFMDGEKGILRYRGIPVEDLAENSTFIETAYLLINGKLPRRKQLNRFSVLLNDNSLVHEDMQHFFQNFPRMAHPMGILSSMVNAVRAFYPEIPEDTSQEAINITFKDEFDLLDVKNILKHSPGVTIYDNVEENLYPMPQSAQHKDDVFIGRLRRDFSHGKSLNMWVVSDNLRKGAATNAIQIAEHLLEHKML